MSTSAHQRGFSLLEVMFAGSILLLGLSAVAGVFSTARNSFAHQRDMATATGIAEAFLEQVVILPPSSPLLDRTPDPPRRFNSEGRPTTATDASRAPFTMSWTVTQDRPIAGMKEIVVDVSWQRSTEHHVRLFTYRD